MELHIIIIIILILITMRRLRGLAVACWTTDNYHPCSNLGVGISEGYFILTSLHYLRRSLGPFSLPCA